MIMQGEKTMKTKRQCMDCRYFDPYFIKRGDVLIAAPHGLCLRTDECVKTTESCDRARKKDKDISVPSKKKPFQDLEYKPNMLTLN